MKITLTLHRDGDWPMNRHAHKRAFLAFMAGKSIIEAAHQHGLDPCDLERFIRAVGRWPGRVFAAWVRA